LLGTVRAFDADVRNALAERIERVLRGVCESSGATYTFDYLRRYPVTSNDAEQTRWVRALAAAEIGATRVIEAPKLMGAEDFSFFAERVPACFYSVGCNGGPATSFPHHHAKFDIDERALETGVRMMTALALNAPEMAP
jgi:amidohydrolase